ncbi:MAG: OB-fold domain-containing protein [Alphaproteobacteria bacterium]|nr:OB-fold domain-containing protein [Alphaproteobacteria bacterium]
MAERTIGFVGDAGSNPETKPYWDGCNAGKLMLTRCKDTGKVFTYPRGVSPFTLSANVEWFEAKGTGVLYSYSTMERANPPYTIAYVTLDEGTTMMTGITDTDASKLKIGQKVKVVFKDTETGQKVPFFTPA